MQTNRQTAIAEPIKSIDQSVVSSIAIHISFEMLLATIQSLPHHQQWQLYQTLATKLAPISAQAKAISRLSDEDNPSKWITVMEAQEEVDEEALDAWLVTEGYPQNNV